METIRGQASGVQQRFEQALRMSWAVWDFRIERKDANGSPLPRVPVEMRGRRFEGAINTGDMVEIAADWKPGEILHTRHVRNLSTGVTVTAKGVTRKQWIAISMVGPLLAVIVAVLVWTGLLSRWIKDDPIVRPIPIKPLVEPK